MAVRGKFSFTLTSVAVLVLASADSLPSQIRARVDLVVVPVSVQDNNGVLITQLERDDFNVFEDGKRQTITNFSVDEQPLSAAIVIDDGINGNALKRLIPLLHSLVAAFTPNDEMTSFRYDHFISKLSDFTIDRDQIEKSFRELSQIADTRPNEPEQPAVYSKIEKKTPGILRVLAGLFSIGSNGAPSSTPTAPAPRPAPDSRIMHTAVYQAADALRSRPEGRRKIILLISDGVVAEPRVTVVPGQTLHSLNKNVELLIKDDVEVFAINTTATLLARPSSVLNSYAQATGGDVYGGYSASDMQFAFNRITEQARTEYVLGYVSSNVAPPSGVYRKIDVTSGDRDQKRKVTHRQGYFQYPIPDAKELPKD